MAFTKNMTEGKPFPLLMRFALPLMATNVLQFVYNIVDSAVVGRLIGIQAFAAVGAAGFFYWLVLTTVTGCCQGFGAVLARYFGARDTAGLKKAYANALLLCLFSGVIVTIISIIATRPLLIAMQTPADILEDTALYLRWMFGGLLVSFGFNITGSVFFAIGDSKTPLFVQVLAAVVNMILDVVLVLWTPLGVAAVAVATIIAQALSFFICMLRLRRVEALRLRAGDWKIDRAMLAELMRMGFPIGFQNAVAAIGGVFIQYFINGYGMLYVAGIAAAKRLYGLLQIICAAIDGAIATYVAQNYGAKKMERITEGVVCARRIMLLSCAFIMALLFPFGRNVLSLLVSGNPQELSAMLDIATMQLFFMLALFPALNMLYVYRSALLGIGDSFFPMLSGFLEMGLRILAVLILPHFFQEYGVYFAEVAGWPFVAAVLYPAYKQIFRKKYRNIAQS